MFQSTQHLLEPFDQHAESREALVGVRSVHLDLEYAGEVADPWGNSRIVFSATTEINREDFGLTWNQVLESGGGFRLFDEPGAFAAFDRSAGST